jgi:hypothetical protein
LTLAEGEKKAEEEEASTPPPPFSRAHVLPQLGHFPLNFFLYSSASTKRQKRLMEMAMDRSIDGYKRQVGQPASCA